MIEGNRCPLLQQSSAAKPDTLNVNCARITAVITSNASKVEARGEGLGQKPRTGSKVADFSLVSRLPVANIAPNIPTLMSHRRCAVRLALEGTFSGAVDCDAGPWQCEFGL